MFKWTQNMFLLTVSVSAYVRFNKPRMISKNQTVCGWIDSSLGLMMRVGFGFFTLNLDGGRGEGQRLQPEGSGAGRWVCGGVVGCSADQGRGVDGCSGGASSQRMATKLRTFLAVFSRIKSSVRVISANSLWILMQNLNNYPGRNLQNYSRKHKQCFLFSFYLGEWVELVLLPEYSFYTSICTFIYRMWIHFDPSEWLHPLA